VLNVLVDLSMIIAGLAVVVVPCWKKLRRIEGGVATIWRVVLGSPAEDARPAVPGVMQRLDSQDTELAAIRSQMAALTKP
jgi:hypothetical protein